jgi:hypothetical protein
MSNPEFNPSDITIKSLKILESLSEETYCYSATVYLKGKPFCKASNHGNGGPDSFVPIKNIDGAFNALRGEIERLELSISTFPVEGYPDLTNSLELVVGELIETAQRDKQVKNVLKRIAFSKTEGGKRSIFQLPSKVKPTAQNIQAYKNQLIKSNKDLSDYIFLNELPFGEARKLILDI